MKGYITAIAAAAILSAFGEMLIPKGWSKYIGIMSGAVLLITLISPLLTLRGIDAPRFELPNDGYIEYDIAAETESQFKQTVEKDAAQRVYDEFGISCRVSAEVSTEKGVLSLTLGCRHDASVASRLREVYGCEVIFNG